MYLYPTKVQVVDVNLDILGKIIVSYPKYNEQIKGWSVTAFPDGHLINKADNKEYSYLFWEAETNDLNIDLVSGFVVRGQDTEKFLQEKLAEIGLLPKEYNEFIVYWLPKMQNNPYNLIHFAGDTYTDSAQLTIAPKPDSVLRVFMVYKPLAKSINVSPQIFPKFERNGFTVVEWGGTEIKD
ncbi:hypothetical protein GYA49_04090 [Candidatus Beckwithbacteria bacterium]|nr:hypothetical protein [Candidatus Beckwithbacteria bacterium]